MNSTPFYYQGVKYKDDCPAERMIPIYLIVVGTFGIVRHFLGMHAHCKRICDDNNTSDDEAQNKKTFLERLIDCFLVAWFIAGNVWIYRIFEPSYDKMALDGLYCDKTMYLFSFWLMTGSYIFMGVLCCCMCCVACAAVFRNDEY